MTKRCCFAVLFLLCAPPLVAQHAVRGRFTSSPAQRVVKPQQDESFGIHFPTTPVNTSSTVDCYFSCFFQGGSPPSSCNFSGTISLVKPLGAPFRLKNLRKAQVGSCQGTPTNLPVSLAAGEWLLHDFEFAPTQPGVFTDLMTESQTPTGSSPEQFSWVLMGSTSGQRARLQPQDCGSSARSIESNTFTSIEFKNFAPEPVNVYWINFMGQRILSYARLAPGESYIQITYVTHPWVVIGSNTGACYGIFTAIREPGLAEVAGAVAPCTPPQVAPQVSSPNTNLRVGDQATVSWTTSESVDRFALEVRSSSGTTRTFHVPGSQRSVTFGFPDAGTFQFKVVAENSCGRREGTPVLTFNIAPPPPRLALTTSPPGMMGIAGLPPASDSFNLTNLGGSPTAVQLQRTGPFFNLQPTEFVLGAGASRVITVTATIQAVGQHEGEIVASGTGGANEVRIPVRLLVETRPSGNPDPQPDANRVDLTGVLSESPQGSVRFQNRGNGSVKGILLAERWIVLEQKFVILNPGQSVTVNFRIDRALRARNFGSEVGRIILVYLEGAPAKAVALKTILGATPPPGSKSTLVTVTDTVKPPVEAGVIPPIEANEVAYYVSGVGQSWLRFNNISTKSDVTVLNASLAEESNLRVFYTETSRSGDNSQSTSFSGFAANQTLSMSDVVKGVFGQPAEGALQVRASSGSLLSIDARTFYEIPTGTLGARIPVFRSDRAAASEEKLYLTGLRSDANFRTDLFLQETAGQAGSVSFEFLGPTGNSVSPPVEAAGGLSVPKFSTFTDLAWTSPAGAVTMVVTNTSVAGGRIQAYAKVMDLRNGDSWIVADWARVNGYTRNEPVAIPVVGKVNGRNGTSYRSDVTLMNTGTDPAGGTLTFFPSVGPPKSAALTLAANESRTFTDVLASQFGLTGGIGYLIFSPSGGSFVVSSRAYTTTATGATISAGVPAVPLSSALKLGEVRKISNIEDVTSVSVVNAKPGTFRTNFGLLETLGNPATVRVTLRYTAVQGSASTVGVSTADFALAPGEFLMWSSITTAVLQSRRGDFGDLRDLQADFEVIDGTGNVMVFVTSTENGTNDTAVRVD